MAQQVATALEKTYDETLDLLIETRNYMAYKAPRDCRGLDAEASLRVSCEAFRVTSRLTQVMAWLMAQRAAHAGEIDIEEACADHFRLSGHGVCLDEGGDGADLPGGLRSLMRRSLHLYRRIDRLDNQTAAQVRSRSAALTFPAVPGLMRQSPMRERPEGCPTTSGPSPSPAMPPASRWNRNSGTR